MINKYIVATAPNVPNYILPRQSNKIKQLQQRYNCKLGIFELKDKLNGKQ